MLWAPRYAEVSMRRALALYLDLNTKHPDHPTIDLQANVRAALDVIRREEPKKRSGNILMFVGLRMEEAGIEANGKLEKADGPMRFLPTAFTDMAKREIQRAIKRELANHGEVLFGMAAAASGSDLLFHEVCDELSIRTRLYLALPKDQYIGEYVAPAGVDWVERFKKIYQSRKVESRKVTMTEADSEMIVNVLAESMELPRWLQSKPSYTVGKRNAVWMLQHAMVQRYIHDAEGTNLTLMVLWARQEVDARGSMADLAHLAQKIGIKVVHIDCSDWGKAQTRTEEAEGNGAGRDYTSDLELVPQL